MLIFSDVTFVLFRFRLSAFTEAAALRSIVLRSSICMRPDSHTQLPTTACVIFLFLFLPFFVSLEMSLFPSIFVPLPFYLCMPEYGDGQADAGWDCRNRLARPKYRANGGRDREKNIFPAQLTTSRIGNLTRLILTLAVCDDHVWVVRRTFSPSGWCFSTL